MANETDEAKAAKAKADADKAKAKPAADKAAADKAKADAAKAEAEAAAAAAKSAAKKRAKDELQEHVITREVMHDGDLYAAGDEILLTFAQHAQLHASGVVEGAWRD